MNLEIRKLFEDIIQILNNSNAPAEAKRMILFIVLEMIEKQADELIATELEAKNAESIQQDKLEELSE